MKYNKDNITVTDSEYKDVLNMQDNLTADDVVEIEAMGMTSLECLTASYNDSIYKYTCKVKGVPVCMFGLNPDSLLGDKAKIWMLATDELKTIQRRFARHSKEVVREYLEDYPLLYNYIDVRNTESIKWLKWLGAKMLHAVPYGINGESFFYFEFSNKKEIKNIFSNNVDLPPRKKIMMFEKMLENHPSAIHAEDKNAPPVQHSFTEGMYTRTISIPKGMVLTGALHKHDHPNFLLKGKVEVYTEDCGLQKLEAPQVIMSKSGTKRVVFTLEDTIWSTVHLNPNNIRDPKKLRSMISFDTYEDREKENIECLSCI